jgi:hypothetical protein
VPLRTVLWLLLAVVAGSTIGFGLALPGSDSTPVPVAAAPTPQANAPFTFAPPTGRPVKAVALDTGGPSLSPGLRPLAQVEAATGLRGARSGADGTLAGEEGTISFNSPYSADMTFFSFPGSASGSTTTTPTTGGETFTTTTPAAPTGPPPTIETVRTLSLTPFAATLSWHTSEAASSRASYGLGSPVIWTAPTPESTEHRVTITGLTQLKSYRLDITATTADGRRAVAEYVLTTPAVTSPVRATTDGGKILADGEIFFPKIVWAQCTDGVAGNIAVGIDTFMGNGCGSGAKLASWLGGAALVLADALAPAEDRAGVAGTHLPDEWDTHLPGDLTVADVNRIAPPTQDAYPRFLTLTNHFYSRAEPLPQGRGMYPALAASADVLGFDLYPMQNWCRFDDFGHVFDSQLDLIALARGKPTFQWIEVRQMDCRGPELDPTPETVRAESWMSIAAGAHAIGYFPNNWNADVGREIARTNEEITTLTAALVEPNIAASASLGSYVKVGARELNGAVYVIAVNASRASTSATITVPALGDRVLRTLDGSQTVAAASGAFSDNFGPLEVRIYIAAPA